MEAAGNGLLIHTSYMFHLSQIGDNFCYFYHFGCGLAVVSVFVCVLVSFNNNRF